MADLSTVDPVAIVVAHLRGSTRIASEFGGPEHVSGLVEAPWPHIVVAPGAGGDPGDLIWMTEREVSIEVLDHPAGTLGRAELFRLAWIVLLECKQLENTDDLYGGAVVSRVRPSGVAAWSPTTVGQGRFLSGVAITLHPAP